MVAKLEDVEKQHGLVCSSHSITLCLYTCDRLGMPDSKVVAKLEGVEGLVNHQYSVLSLHHCA